MENNTEDTPQTAELKARLKAFALILRLGRDAFEQPDLKAAAVHIVNNTRSLLPYLRSTLLDTRTRTPELLAQYAQIESNPHSEHAEQLRQLLPELTVGEEPLELSAADLSMLKLDEEADNALKALTANGRRLLIVPLRSVRSPESAQHPFLWVLEWEGEIPPPVSATVGLISGDYGNALWCCTLQKRRWDGKTWTRDLSPAKILAALGILFLLSLFVIRPEHNIAAEFVTRPQSVFHSYAWFDSVVKHCFVEDGDTVRKGDKILEYDTERMRFQLAAAEAAFKEASADYEQESLTAFTDREKLGKVKMLALKREQAAIAIEEAKWYLKHSVVTAPVDGVVALADGQSDKLVGRALRTGEKQFDILGGNGMVAEVMINEKDASVLRTAPKITLFLHTSPEIPIPAAVLSARHYPELTEQNTYCYIIRTNPEREVRGMRYGMRGIARVRGERVSLGYYLFRSLVLWWRGV